MVTFVHTWKTTSGKPVVCNLSTLSLIFITTLKTGRAAHDMIIFLSEIKQAISITNRILKHSRYQFFDSKIQSDLLRFLRKYKMCFKKPEWKFLDDKYHEVSSFYGLPKIHKSMVIESTINNQNREIIEIF